MAGYLFNLDSITSLHSCIETGSYSARLNFTPKSSWGTPAEATLGDYITMTPGDDIYFFIERKIYGIGKLKSIGPDGKCCYKNHPSALNPQAVIPNENCLIAIENEERRNNERWVCFFEPSPSFLRNGVDMDDMLASNPLAFKALRTFWKRTFIKFDDIESQAFKDACLLGTETGETINFTHTQATHNRASDILNQRVGNYKLNPNELVQFTLDERDPSSVRHEMVIECNALNAIINGEDIFGRWNYVHHQVAASPMKPVDYMDRMDIFGYSYLNNHKPTKSAYLVGEVKKGLATVTDLEQLMNYVDWVRDEYAHGNYNLIRACLIAKSFNRELIDNLAELSARRFVKGRRPPHSQCWNQVKLISYEAHQNSIQFNTLHGEWLPW